MRNQYIFTMVFGLLLFSAYAKPPKTSYFVGKYDGNLIQINNPQVVNKKQFCVLNITVNGKKIKTDYKIGGVEFNPSEYGFAEGTELLITISHRKDCEPTFHSQGFKSQKD
jgi:hypothetical protein